MYFIIKGLISEDKLFKLQKKQLLKMRLCSACNHRNEKTEFFCAGCNRLQEIELGDDVSIFSIFTLQPSLDIDKEQLNKEYSILISKMHPDLFINSDEQEKNIAEKNTSLINQAYKTLSSDVGICDYILSGMSKENDITQDDDEYILETMNLSQELHNISNTKDCEQFKARILFMRQANLSKVKDNIVTRSPQQASKYMARLKFIDRILHNLEGKEQILKSKQRTRAI